MSKELVANVRFMPSPTKPGLYEMEIRFDKKGKWRFVQTMSKAEIELSFKIQL